MTKFEVGSFWRTRDGRKARILANDLVGSHPIAVAASNGDSAEFVWQTTNTGHLVLNGREHVADLIEPWKEPVVCPHCGGTGKIEGTSEVERRETFRGSIEVWIGEAPASPLCKDQWTDVLFQKSMTEAELSKFGGTNVKRYRLTLEELGDEQ